MGRLRPHPITATALILVTAVAVSGSLSAAAKTRTFRTPSKNIVCVYSSAGGPGAYIRCDVLSLNDVGFLLDRRHRAKRMKVTDTAGDVNRAAVLRYGKSRLFGPFRCSSRRSGLTCKSRKSGHGFRLSRHRQRVF
jgi:hypothetical protein